MLCTTLLYSIVLLEYCITFYSSNSALEKKFIISFIIILSIFISVSLVALIVPEEIRLIFNGVAILIISFLPIMFKERIKSVSVDFEHLTERYSLLVILFFGESIVTVTKTINLTSIHITSFFYFLIIIALFSIYSLIHTKGIEKNRQTGGLILIHMHYFVILSIGFVSILLEENIHQEINNAVFSIFLTIGITVFLAALFINWFSYSTNQITAKFMIMISVLLCLFYMNNLLIENMDIYLGMDMILLWLIFGAVYRELKE
ncbi:low temperature requirement protein A [Listeria fleischmannii]|uniref:low temperature requirement protein A n=1 Tax=Listeria fleischmannii TaxID=1069827 RepID=UPI0003A647D9|nr:low temperature requirement protein A [Listeria fleischmannii]